MQNVILLDNSFIPVDVITWKKAVNLMVRGKVEAFGENFITIRTMTSEFLVPKVLRLMNMVRGFYKRSIPCRKRNVFIRDGYACAYCGIKIKRPTLDHIIPRSKGGKTSFENVVTCCSSCNSKKSDRTPREAGMVLRVHPVQPTISEHMRSIMKQNGVLELLDEIFKTSR